MSIDSVLVTGGASGLGLAVVHSVLSAGGRPMVLDLKPPPVDVPYAAVDLAEPRAAEAAVRQLARRSPHHGPGRPPQSVRLDKRATP
jgi:NAD(P)-dependent dehydrogenase (short-subunit alcohol dehydrogenase family)